MLADRPRRDPDFLIVGRTDTAESIDDCIERCYLYLSAGADVAFPIVRWLQAEGMPLADMAPERRLHWLRTIVREIDGPVLTVGGIDRAVTAPQLRDAGFAWGGLPTNSPNAATGAMIDALGEALHDGTASGCFAAHPSPLAPADQSRLLGYDRVAENQRRFGDGKP